MSDDTHRSFEKVIHDSFEKVLLTRSVKPSDSFGRVKLARRTSDISHDRPPLSVVVERHGASSSSSVHIPPLKTIKFMKAAAK